MRIPLTILLSFAFYFPSVVRAATNRTIDDTYGDEITGFKPIYYPPNVWAGPECTGCAIQPEPSKAHNGTWKAATYGHDNLKNMSVTLKFKGTAIYVFFILANFMGPVITTETACEFLLDEQPGIPYSHQGSRSRDMDYNALAFSKAGLQNVDHTLIISTSGFNRHIFVNFDYAIYTFDEDVHKPSIPIMHPWPKFFTKTGSISVSSSGSFSQVIQSSSANDHLPTPASDLHSLSTQGFLSDHNMPSPSGSSGRPLPSDSSAVSGGSKTNVGAIVGGVIGGIIALLILLILFMMLRWRRQAQQSRTRATSAFDQGDPAAFNPTRFTSFHSHNSRFNTEETPRHQRAALGNEIAYEDYGYGGYSMIDTKADMSMQAHASRLKSQR